MKQTKRTSDESSNRLSDGIWNGMELYKRGIYSIPQMTEYLAGNNSQ
ncbi:MAG: hypothetical protein ACJ72Q_12790 [Nitrososphaeraceae archaeon]|jgi:hypothetical protein